MAIGLAVSGLLLFGLAEHTRKSAGEIQFGDLVAVLKGIPFWVLLFAMGCQLTQGWLRSQRYRYLIRWDDEGKVIHLKLKLLAVTFARNMFVDMLPSRSGELMYVWLVKRVFGARLANGFTSLGAAFIFDLIALLALIAVVVGFAFFASSTASGIGLLITLILLVGIAVVGFFVLFPLLMRLSSGLRAHRLRSGWLGNFHSFVDEMSDCIVVLKQSERLFAVLGLSILIRTIKYLGIVTMLFFILEQSFGSVGMSNIGSLFLGIVAGEASASLPIPSFMSFGTYEAGATFTLQSLGFSAQAALISIFIVHLMSQVVDYSMGGLAMLASWLFGWLSPLEPNGANAVKQGIFSRFKFSIIFCSLLLGLFVGIVWFQYQKANAEPEPEMSLAGISEYQENEDDPVLRNLGVKTESTPPHEIVGATENNQHEALKGFAVWSSNRFGNHEIVKYDFETKDLRRLTETSEKEFYVTISPDGTKLVYAREALPGRTPSDLTGWNVILHDLKDGSIRVLSENSFHPSWAGGNDRVVYSRNGNEIVLHDVNSDVKTVILKAGEGGVPAGFQFWTPYYNPASQSLAVTIRGSRRTKMIYSMKPGIPPVEFPEGCQLSWMPGYDQLVFTNHGRLGDNAFCTVRPDGSSVKTLLDLPTAYHHLYFPRFSEDGKWLIYGASKGAHKHDQADYDIFLWRVGTPHETIKHLAINPANDSWPDLHLELN